MAESLFKAGNIGAARTFLLDAEAGVERDFLLGQCCVKLGDAAGAVAAYTSALGRDPRHAPAASALGALYVKLGWLDKAEALYTRTLKKNDDDQLRTELAVLLWQRGRHAKALAETGRVLERNPRHFAARLERGNMLLWQDRNEEAAADLRFLMQEYPDMLQYRGSLGTAEFRLGHYAEAEHHLQEACRQPAAAGNLLGMLAIAQMMNDRLAESRITLQQLRGIDATFDPRPVFLFMVHQEQLLCDWSHRSLCAAVFRDFIADPGTSNTNVLAHISGVVPLEPDERRVLMQHLAAAASAGTEPWRHQPTPVPEKLRIGYVLPHIGDQVVANIMLGLVSAHDAARTEIHVFATQQTEENLRSGRVEQYMAVPGIHYADLTALDENAAAERIRAEKLDVLVDLAVYNDDARPGIMARRPAPVQVNFLGAPFTSGAAWMDYIITDPVVSPAREGWCTEAEVQMPSCYFVHGRDEAGPQQVPPRAQFGLPADKFLFSAFNKPYKIDPQTFDALMRILAATPDSTLLFRGGQALEQNLRTEATRRGINPQRLLFAPKLDAPHDYLLRHGCPDLFLDTLCYGAHATLADALWMGVPGLSCPGDSFQSRVGASLLASCGLHELVVPDADSYVATAVALYNDRPRLQALKEKLAQTRLTAAPFDMQGQARALEKAFRHMRARFAQGLAPAAFRVADLAD
jgi:predicted O-linked N-acetylglucosamine transferase (SPINDLY family)